MLSEVLVYAIAVESISRHSPFTTIMIINSTVIIYSFFCLAAESGESPLKIYFLFDIVITASFCISLSLLSVRKQQHMIVFLKDNLNNTYIIVVVVVFHFHFGESEIIQYTLHDNGSFYAL